MLGVSAWDKLCRIRDKTYPTKILNLELSDDDRAASSGGERSEEGPVGESDDDQEALDVGRAPEPAPMQTRGRSGDNDALRQILAGMKAMETRVNKRLTALEKKSSKTGGDLRKLLPVDAGGDPDSSDDESSEDDENYSRRSKKADGAGKKKTRKGRRRSKSRRRKKKKYASSSSESEGDSSTDDDDSEDVFWDGMAKSSFRGPTLTTKRKEGEEMLKRALENYPTITAYVESLNLKVKRNLHEAMTLARVLDFNIAELGILKTKELGSTHVTIRRIGAISMADRTGNWNVACEIEDSPMDLLSTKQQRQILSAAKAKKALGLLPSLEKPAKKKAGDLE